MKRLFLAVFFTVIIVSPVNAQSTLALQEKCAQGAKKWFFEHINSYGGKWGSFSTEDGPLAGWHTNNFESHYNRKRDKCFIKINWIFSPEDKGKESSTGIDVFDVFEDKPIGNFSHLWLKGTPDVVFSIFEDRELVPFLQADKVNPIVERKKFETLIKPYMEE